MKTFLVPLLSLLLTLSALAATGLKISELPNTNNLANAQLFVVTAGGTNMSITYQKLAALINTSVSNLAYVIGANGTNFTVAITNGDVWINGSLTIPTGQELIAQDNAQIDGDLNVAGAGNFGSGIVTNKLGVVTNAPKADLQLTGTNSYVFQVGTLSLDLTNTFGIRSNGCIQVGGSVSLDNLWPSGVVIGRDGGAKFAIAGNMTGTTHATISALNTSVDDYSILDARGSEVHLYSANTRTLSIITGGKVGINTNIPNANLHVIGDGSSTNLIRAGTTASDGRFWVNTNGDVYSAGNLTVDGTSSFVTLAAGSLVVTSGVPSSIVTNTGASDKQIPMFSIGGGVPGGMTNSTITTNDLTLAPTATTLSNKLAGALSAASLKLTNNIEFTTTLIDGGANITNYTLVANTNDVVIGQSNVNIVAVMGGTLGNPRPLSILVTNGTGFNWYISFSAVTNRWKWPISQGAPSVLTNATQLLINARVDGTNILGSWAYYSWP